MDYIIDTERKIEHDLQIIYNVGKLFELQPMNIKKYLG